MNWKKYMIWLTLLLLVGGMGLGTAVVSAQPRFFLRFTLTPDVYVSIPRSPQVSVSVDRGEGGKYYEGDPITIRYRTTGGGYINLVQYRTDGGVRVLVRNQFIPAGSNQVFNDSISGPSGTESLVALFTPDEVNDSQLGRFIQEPHQVGRIFGRFHVNRTHYEVVSRFTDTSLILDPVNFSIDEGASITMTATLRDVSGFPLPGKVLDWSVTDGSLTTFRSVTGPNGVARVDFFAPPTGGSSVITISVRFAGDQWSSASVAQSTANVRIRHQPSRLLIEPTSFTAAPGDLVRLTATLRDGAGNPVYGRTIFWSADWGSFDRMSAVTDSTGRVLINYRPPNVTSRTNVAVTAEFRGVPGLGPVSQTIFGTIEPARHLPPSATLFYVDFGGRSPVYNVAGLQYSGALVTGYAASGATALEMTPGDTLTFSFNPGGIPEEGAVFVWVQGEARTRLNVRLNNRRIGNITPVSRLLEPDREEKITFSALDFVSETNRLLLEVEGPRNAVLRVQRIIIVF